MPQIIKIIDNKAVFILCEYAVGQGQDEAERAEQVAATYCRSRCVPPDTLIAGDYLPIQNLQNGAHVYGAEGDDEVLKVFQRAFSGEIVSIKAAGLLPLRVSPEHPLLVVTREYICVKRRRKLVLSIPYFKPAKAIIPIEQYKNKANRFGDYLVVPKIKGNNSSIEISLLPFKKPSKKSHPKLTSFPLTQDTAWLLGMYVAEGCSSETGSKFCMGKHEEAYITRIYDIIKKLGFSPRISKRPTATEVCLPSRVLSRAFPFWCGKKAPNKQIPEFILNHKSKKIILSFIIGYLEGDGCYFEQTYRRNKKLQRIKGYYATTTSQKLALQLQLLALRLGLFIRIYYAQRREEKILNRSVKMHARYDLRLPREQSLKQQEKSNRVRFFNNYILTPIYNVVAQPYKGKLYNIRTMKETYLVSNAIVHNCGYYREAALNHLSISCFHPKFPNLLQIIEELKKL